VFALLLLAKRLKTAFQRWSNRLGEGNNFS
jgi:hypothetical protein